MRRRGFGLLLIGGIGLTGLGYIGWRYFSERQRQLCRACLRPVHGHSLTVARTSGASSVYCCPACALSEHRQTGLTVEFVEFTDYLDGAAIRPKDAFFVRASDVNPCLRHDAALTADKQPLHTHFDRCAPGILAFRDESAARGFAEQHGGQFLRFGELAPMFQR